MFKSISAAFKSAEKKLNSLGYELDPAVSDYRPPGDMRGKMIQRHIVGSDAVVLVIQDKVPGMAASYQILVINGELALDMKLHAMTQPADESYHTLIKKT